MKIALLVPNLSIGGAEKAFVYLANEFVASGHETTLFVLDARGPLGRELDDNLRVVELGTQGMFAAIPRLVKRLRDVRPRVLVSTLTHANVIAVWSARAAGVGIRVFVREATTLSRDRHRLLSKPRLVQSLACRAYRQADGVIAVSEGVAADLSRNFRVPRERIQVIDNPAVPGNIDRLMTAPTGHSWFDDSSTSTILAVGRLTHAKDFDTLLRAFSNVVQQRDAAVRLVILGDGELRTALEGLVSSLDLRESVSMPGFVENPFAFMSRASLFVLSSRREGMPNVLIQAMASGCPVVATDCKSGPRELLAGGRLGPLVPVGDRAALAAAMLQRLDAPRGSDSLRRAVERFSVGSVGRKYLEYVKDGTSSRS